MKQEYAVVKMNSTTGPYVVEKSSPSSRRSSHANIAWSGTSQRQASKIASYLNAGKCPGCGKSIDVHVGEFWRDAHQM